MVLMAMIVAACSSANRTTPPEVSPRSTAPSCVGCAIAPSTSSPRIAAAVSPTSTITSTTTRLPSSHCREVSPNSPPPYGAIVTNTMTPFSVLNAALERLSSSDGSSDVAQVAHKINASVKALTPPPLYAVEALYRATWLDPTIPQDISRLDQLINTECGAPGFGAPLAPSDDPARTSGGLAVNDNPFSACADQPRPGIDFISATQVALRCGADQSLVVSLDSGSVERHSIRVRVCISRAG